MSEKTVNITAEMKRSYNRRSAIRDVSAIFLATLIWVFGPTFALVTYAGTSMWLPALLYIPWMIFCNVLYCRVLVKLIWRYTVELDEEKFVKLAGKTYIPPPERFKDIWKYQGERDFDYVINQYKGWRIIKWSEKAPYVVRFFKEEDAIHFKLACY